MLALIYDGSVRLDGDYPQPSSAAGAALVKVRVAGVCRTDLEVARGYMDFSGVMGHECVAEVVEGPDAWQGKRVAIEINCRPCGRCNLCGRGLTNHCPTRTVLGIDGRDGVFAEYASVPVANLHEIPAQVSDDAAVFVEPLAAALQILEQVAVSRSDRMVVLGDGRLGQLCARVLQRACDSVVLLGKHEAKLSVAAAAGIDTTLLADFTASGDADVVVDATGTPSGFELAMAAVRARGTIVLKSTFATDTAMNLAPLVINEVTVVGSRCGPFDAAIAALADGSVQVTDLITARFPLANGVKALSVAEESGNIKVLLDVG